MDGDKHREGTASYFLAIQSLPIHDVLVQWVCILDTPWTHSMHWMCIASLARGPVECVRETRAICTQVLVALQNNEQVTDSKRGGVTN